MRRKRGCRLNGQVHRVVGDCGIVREERERVRGFARLSGRHGKCSFDSDAIEDAKIARITGVTARNYALSAR